MPWVKFSDDWYDDGKLAGADPWVIAMWAVGITWCARNLSDGFIPAGEHRRLLNLYGTFDSDGQQVHPDRVADELVVRGSWQAIAGGYEVVNYHRYQPTRADVLEKREAERARKASARNPAGRAAESAAGPTPPVPVPEEPSSSSSPSDLGLPAGLWTKVAEKRLAAQQAKGVEIASPARWIAKTAENARRDEASKALSLLEGFDLNESQLADVLVLGTNPPWLSHYRRPAS